MSEFILMLTRDDETVPNAADLLDQALQTEIKHIGFKDIGLAVDEMRELVKIIKAAGRFAHIEVVSLTEEDELNSAQTAIDLGVDYLIGGTRWKSVKRLIGARPIKYFPYPGEIVGHPAKLVGSVDQIVAGAEAMEDVDGINLLAYRHETIDGAELLADVQKRVSLPIIAAGSITTLERVRAVAATGAWAFTIGQAALEGRLVEDPALQAQITATLTAAAEAEAARS